VEVSVTGWESWADRWAQAPESAPTTLTVDVHTHVKVPEAAEEAMTRFSPELDPRSLYSSDETNALNRAYHESVDDRFTDPEARVRDMDTGRRPGHCAGPAPVLLLVGRADSSQGGAVAERSNRRDH